MVCDTSRLRPVESGLGGHEEGVSVLTTGSRKHLPSYENGHNLPGQIIPPSVVLSKLSMKVSVRIVKKRIYVVTRDMFVGRPCVILFLSSAFEKTEQKRDQLSFVWFDDVSQREKIVASEDVIRLVVMTFPRCCLLHRCPLHSQLWHNRVVSFGREFFSAFRISAYFYFHF